MFASKLLRWVVILPLVISAASIISSPGVSYQPSQYSVVGIGIEHIAANETTTTQSATVTSSLTSVVTTTVTSNQTITATTTISMFGNSDLITLVLAAVAVAALVIAVFALLRRPRARSAGPAAASVSRVIICPTCGTSNKPGATYCRKCRTQLR